MEKKKKSGRSSQPWQANEHHLTQKCTEHCHWFDAFITLNKPFNRGHWECNSHTLATWREQLTPWKRPWCWDRLKSEGDEDDRRWDGWMASLMHGRNFGKLQEMVGDQVCCSPWGHEELDTLGNWTTTTTGNEATICQWRGFNYMIEGEKL